MFYNGMRGGISDLSGDEFGSVNDSNMMLGGGLLDLDNFEDDIQDVPTRNDIDMRISAARVSTMKRMRETPIEISPSLRLNPINNLLQRTKDLVVVTTTPSVSMTSGTSTNQVIQAPPAPRQVINTSSTTKRDSSMEDIYEVSEEEEEEEEDDSESDYDSESEEEEEETRKERRRRKKRERKHKRTKRKHKRTKRKRKKQRRRERRRERKSFFNSSILEKRPLVPMAMKKFDDKMSAETRGYLFTTDVKQDQLDIYESGIKFKKVGFTSEECDRLVTLFTRIGVGSTGGNGANSREIGSKYCNGRTFQNVRKVFMAGKFHFMRANPIAQKTLKDMYKMFHTANAVTTTTTTNLSPPPHTPMVVVLTRPMVPAPMVPMDIFTPVVVEEEIEEVDQELERLKKSQKLYRSTNRYFNFKSSDYLNKKAIMEKYMGDYTSVLEKDSGIVEEFKKWNSVYNLEKDHNDLMTIKKNERNENSLLKKRNREEREGGVVLTDSEEKAIKKRKID